MKRVTWSIVVIGLLSAGCASTGGSSMVRNDIGTASLPDAYDVGMRILRLNQFEIELTDTVADLRIETRWKGRRPFADELDLGIFDAESRVIITGRQRSVTTLGPVFAIYMTVENRVRPEATGLWVDGTHTPMFRAYAAEMVEAYKRQIADIGIRRH